jgi:hypothetical protein
MWVVVLLLVFVPTSAYSQPNQIDCAPLDPRISVTRETEAKVKASVSTVYKVAQVYPEPLPERNSLRRDGSTCSVKC